MFRESLERVPQDKWHTLLLGSHLGYISWEEYQENQRRLQENTHALGPDRRKSPPREGPALLQGLVICGICGERMKVIYHVRAGGRVPDYICDGRTVDNPQPICQWISGKDVDEGCGRTASRNRDAGSDRSNSRYATRIASPSGRGGAVAQTAGGTRSL